MAIRIYLMPIAGAGTSADPRAPKYSSLFGGANWTMMDYGPEPVCIVGVENIGGAAHSAVVANADVTAAPADLTQQIGGQLTAVQAALDSLNIPSNWITSGMTYARVLRILVFVFLFLQRLNGLLPGVRVFGGGVTLATRINQLPANIRTALSDTATSFGFDTSALTGVPTLRVALKGVADQFPDVEMLLGTGRF